MSNNSGNNSGNNLDQPIPLGQRLYDNPWWLLVAGNVVMFAFYTIWGLYEIYSLPQATLP